jgi:hypothetical protein
MKIQVISDGMPCNLVSSCQAQGVKSIQPSQSLIKHRDMMACGDREGVLPRIHNLSTTKTDRHTHTHTHTHRVKVTSPSVTNTWIPMNQFPLHHFYQRQMRTHDLVHLELPQERFLEPTNIHLLIGNHVTYEYTCQVTYPYNIHFYMWLHSSVLRYTDTSSYFWLGEMRFLVCLND